MKNCFIKVKELIKKKRIWIVLLFLLLLFLTARAFYYYGLNSVPKDYNLMGLYRQKYNDQFTSKHFPVGNYYISYVFPNSQFFDDDTVKDIDRNATPRIVVQDLNVPVIRELYEVSFTYNGKEESGNIIYLNNLAVKNNFLVGQ